MKCFTTKSTIALSFTLWLIQSIFLSAIELDNRGRWETPSEKGPDTAVPGFLINLGPTGARATLESQSFTVKYIFPDSPAAGKLKLDDIITGVNGNKFTVPHTFGHHMTRMKEFPEVGYEGPIMDFGNAIEESEGADGNLSLSITRDGKHITVTVPLKAIGKFSDTFPENCPKSELIAKQAAEYLSGPGYSYIKKEPCHAKGMSGLALLSNGNLKQAKELAHSWNNKPHAGIWVWPVGYQCIFLCEYYLLTNDKTVLPTIQSLATKLEHAQVEDMANYKERTHGSMGNVGHKFRTGGMGHNTNVGGYGTMNITTALSLVAWEMAKKCEATVDQDKIQLAFDYLRSSTDSDGYIGYHTAAGAYAAGGRQGISIVAHHLAGDSQLNPDYNKTVTKGLMNSHKYLPDAHADGMLSVCWGLIGANLCNDTPTTRAIMDYNKAWFNMARSYDGSFISLPGRDKYDKGYYLSSRHQLTATMAIILNAKKPTLKLQGK
ncbi:MAG: DUF6288 domain-containing protein [Akkermansiaceae bacterium]